MTNATGDSYLWLEDVTGEAALQWVRESNQPTITDLTSSTRFAEMEATTLAALDSDDRIPYVRRRGEFLYNLWRDARHVRGLWRRTTLESYRTANPEWDVLIDVDALADEEGENWVWKGASVCYPDYQRALISLSRGGADATVVREFDLTTRTWVSDGFALDEAKSEIGWIDHDSVFVGTDIGTHTDGHPSLTASGYPRVFQRWTRGRALHDAPVVFAADYNDVGAHLAHDHTPGFERDFVITMHDFYHRSTAELRDGVFHVLEVPSDAHTIIHRQWLLVLTRSDWQLDGQKYTAGTLLAFDYDSFLAGDTTAHALFIPDAHTSLDDVAFTASHVVLITLRDVATEVSLRQIGTWERSELTGIPELATVSIIGTDSDVSDELFLSASSFTQPPSLLYGSTTDGVAVIKQAPELFDATGISAHQMFATSADGTAIPYFVIKKDDVQTAPTLLYGYGGFEVSQTPGYTAVAARNWITRGGIYVIANIRGGGEYGPTWHTQALKADRHKVFEDFTTVANSLVEQGLTRHETLAAQGGSNGGLLMGVMITRYPELFGAVICQVPLLDMKRYHLLHAGASWIAEYGDPDRPDEWAYLSQYSPYQHIQRDRTYPQVLMTTSTRDDRVHPGHARKFTARMREYGHTVHYYENIEGGHGGAADNKQLAFTSAMAYEFLWRTVGSA